MEDGLCSSSRTETEVGVVVIDWKREVNLSREMQGSFPAFSVKPTSGCERVM